MAAEQEKGSVWAGFLWMLLLSMLLFWIPVVGPLIAGIVGGRAAGSPGRGLTAAILPAIIMAIIIVIASTLLLVPGVGLLTGASVILAAIVQAAPLVIGALLGGSLAP